MALAMIYPEPTKLKRQGSGSLTKRGTSLAGPLRGYGYSPADWLYSFGIKRPERVPTGVGLLICYCHFVACLQLLRSRLAAAVALTLGTDPLQVESAHRLR
jgi:hypothetical protein